jgi:hypothetical protein
MTKINIEGTTKQLVGKFEDKLILKELFTGIKETKYYKDNIKLD